MKSAYSDDQPTFRHARRKASTAVVEEEGPDRLSTRAIDGRRRSSSDE